MPARNITGQRIRELRTEQHLSQEQLAALIDTSQRQVSKYETGSNDPTAHVLDLLANALETTTDYLIGRTDSPVLPLLGRQDLSKFEREFIEVVRGVSGVKRKEMLAVIKTMAEHDT